MRWWLACVVVLLASCATSRTGVFPDGVAAGADADHPLKLCGAVSAAYHLSHGWQCPGGAHVFGGDVTRAVGAHVGSRENAAGQTVEFYDVPCPEGTRRVYVDESCPLPARTAAAVKFRITGTP